MRARYMTAGFPPKHSRCGKYSYAKCGFVLLVSTGRIQAEPDYQLFIYFLGVHGCICLLVSGCQCMKIPALQVRSIFPLAGLDEQFFSYLPRRSL